MPEIEKPNILTVSQLTRRVKDLLETQISYVWVSGEISNWRVSPAGHAYFTLKDPNSQIDAVMFRGKLMQTPFAPENGLEVIAFGLVTVYEKRGNYQIVCDEIHPKGVGALQLAFEKLKRKLEEEGLFKEEHKKPLPLFPRRIGIVTSPTGAAIRDILNVINRRFANVHIILYPARVQGEEAAGEIVEGIRTLDAYGVDVMIVGRGGGSLEDLWPFNEEIVVRAVYEAKTPIISAVGHEIDFTLTDFAADVRAPTPSAAAELVVREREALLERIQNLQQRLAKSVRYRIEAARNRLRLAASAYVFRRPEELIRQRRQWVDECRDRLEQSFRSQMDDVRRRVREAGRALSLLSPKNQLLRVSERLGAIRVRLLQSIMKRLESSRVPCRTLVAQLHALSPLAVLARGYSVTWKLPERSLVKNASELSPDAQVAIQFGKGKAIASIEAVEGEQDGVLEL
ncbi:MAG TPA: exodeoxyribonuclease VII large subunit [Candidatus Hydrogenedentes bacterium]|nr:exodeoxyribonuclease VII large subunit [Candidatus Hydrogenedentota bacterium]HOL75840.1 exodeoxyribonuclease VII large subunit [Candidatus Hydrogenedentota bacterium]HPO86342.1 exodeoxyribonuclease VII large subunit [Candidatus Hydrogenedentota bacterium]